MKTLFLMRHGHSPSASEAGVATDALRPLSKQGREEILSMAQELSKRSGRPGLILHSPLTRAAQTGAAAAEALCLQKAAEVFAPLDNTLPPEEVLAALAARAGNVEKVLAVGHQPQVGEITMLLTRTLFDFRPGGIVAVELGEKNRLLWTLNYDELR